MGSVLKTKMEECITYHSKEHIQVTRRKAVPKSISRLQGRCNKEREEENQGKNFWKMSKHGKWKGKKISDTDVIHINNEQKCSFVVFKNVYRFVYV
tara:strand:- start:832 stop:1119 length:288 start_codon:yes stop_codon:yes gene_type:complete